MHRHFFFFAVVFVIGLSLTLAEEAPQPTKPARQSSSTKDAPDILHGPIEPFLEGPERTLFLKAAGVDSELSEEEFVRDRQREGGFVHEFDRWEVLIRYDNNRNGILDWFEFKSYLQVVRDYVLHKFDVNGDRRLSDIERERAKLDLRDGFTGQGVTLADVINKHDSNGDGIITRTEFEAGVKEWKKIFDAQYKSRELGRWDANNNGVIDVGERELVMEREYQESNARILDRYDADLDGKLNEGELQEYRRERESADEQLFDLDNNGALSQEEREEYAKSSRGQYWADFDKYDIRPDGVHDVEERKAFWAYLRTQVNAEVAKQQRPDTEINSSPMNQE